MISTLAWRLGASLILGAGGCTHLPLMGCPAGLERAEVFELVLGRNVGGTVGVSDAEWAAFLDEEVTPRFPDGFTVIDAAEQWRGADGTIVREPSKVLLLVATDPSEAAEPVEAVREAYVRRFEQEAVLLIRAPACAGF